MKKTLLLLALSALLYKPSHAQNLLPNPDFEIRSSCPSVWNDNFMGGGYYAETPAIGWYQATFGTPDYFNACDSTGKTVWVPANFFGYQPAFSGSGYMGLYTHLGIDLYPDVPDPEWQEYIMCRITALEPGATYKLSVRVSLSNISAMASDGLGALFTTYGSKDTGSPSTIARPPQISFNSYGTLKDTANWMSLTGSFVADSAYTSFIFGCFNNASTIHVDTVTDIDPHVSPYAYYYVDSVSLIRTAAANTIINVNNISANTIYPNPFTSTATLTFDDHGTMPCNVTVYNTIGQEVSSYPDVTGGSVEIERNNLSPGIYYYRIRREATLIGAGTFRIY